MELKHFCTSIANQCVELLIVPYGIETRLLVTPRVRVILLIVPYGIETRLTY